MPTNTFKNSQATNITTVTTVYTAPAAKTSMLIQLDIANTTTSDVLSDVQITDTSATSTAYLVKNVVIPTGSSLQVISGQKIILETGDLVKVTSNGAVDVIAGILEDI